MQRKPHKHPQHRTRFNSPYNGIKPYISRNVHTSSVYGGPGKGRTLCINCRKLSNYEHDIHVCPICGEQLYFVPPRIRIPRKTASKYAWATFLKKFSYMVIKAE